jgi:hypothetical protein
VNDRKAGAAARSYLAGLTGAESPAHKQNDGLAQGLMSVPGDGDRLRMQIVGDIDRRAHNTIVPSAHHDALMRFVSR